MDELRQLPKLRFSGFNENWKSNILGEISDINPGTSKLPERFIYIDLESVVNGELIKEQIVNKDEAPSRAQRLLEKGDIIFQMVRPYQKNNYFFNNDGVYVASTGYAQIKSKINSAYLYQYLHLQKLVDEVIEKCTGTSYPAINSSDLSKIKVCYPSLEEQQKIATFLTVVDAKLQSLKKKKELIEQYKKGIMQKIFSQELRFKDDKGKEFPDWVEKKVGEIFTFKVTNSYSRENLNYEHGIVKNIHYGDIHTKFNTLFNIEKEIVPFINHEISITKITEENYCKKGDIILADASEDLKDVGKCIELININGCKVLSGLHTILARPFPELFAIGFLGYAFSSNKVRTQIQKEAQGSKVLSISVGRLSNIVIEIPSIQEQQKITSIMQSIDIKLQHTHRQINSLINWKKGLLQKLFV